MVEFFPIRYTPSVDDFDEAGYLAVNPDVAAAVADGAVKSGLHHFRAFGLAEGRSALNVSALTAMRSAKLKKIKPLLRTDMTMEWIGEKADFLTPALRAETRIVETDAVSANGYDGYGEGLIFANPDGLVLDCGAGSRDVYYENVVNYEIVNYPSTDVLGVGEALPFKDDSFDGVISVAVLEHVRDPFQCAREISRVLKPGGRLYCAMPFLQPYHGYPHHYFNATAQGVRRLFEDQLTVDDVDVIDSVHPIFALNWIASSWAAGLSGDDRAAFESMTVKDLLRSPIEAVREPFCQALSKEKKLELACATIMFAHKA